MIMLRVEYKKKCIYESKSNNYAKDPIKLNYGNCRTLDFWYDVPEVQNETINHQKCTKH